MIYLVQIALLFLGSNTFALDPQDGLYAKTCLSADGTLSDLNYDFNSNSLEKRIVNKVTTTKCYVEELEMEIEAEVETISYEEHEVRLPSGGKMVDLICAENQYMPSVYKCKEDSLAVSIEYSPKFDCDTTGVKAIDFRTSSCVKSRK